jgi:8-oxo-dGTP pyrophosphatase MutT (NUDIX family)
MKPARTTGIQYAALPYRIEARQVQVLLITSRGTRRWVIPKGWPMPGLKPQDAAALEAAEEAGVTGEIEAHPIGSYHYEKGLKDARTAAVQVIVFPLLVTGQADAWKEQKERTVRWFRAARAAPLVAEPALRRLILDFAAARAPGLLAQGLRTYRSWRATRG